MTPEKKAEYRKLAEEVMEPVLTVAARRLGQAVEEIHTSQIKPLRDEIERLSAQQARDEEHYQAMRGMSEKHRKLWVEAQQANAEMREALERMHKAFNADKPIPKREGDALEVMCRTLLARKP